MVEIYNNELDDRIYILNFHMCCTCWDIDILTYRMTVAVAFYSIILISNIISTVICVLFLDKFRVPEAHGCSS